MLRYVKLFLVCVNFSDHTLVDAEIITRNYMQAKYIFQHVEALLPDMGLHIDYWMCAPQLVCPCFVTNVTNT